MTVRLCSNHPKPFVFERIEDGLHVVIREPCPTCKRKYFDASIECGTYTIQQAAQRLGVAPITIRRELNRGRLTKIYIGKALRVSRYEVDALLQSRKTQKDSRSPSVSSS